jgi:hypothetical protein
MKSKNLLLQHKWISFYKYVLQTFLIVETFEKEVNNSLRGNVKRQLVQRKGQMCLRLPFQIICYEKYLQKGLCAKKKLFYLKTLVF